MSGNQRIYKQKIHSTQTLKKVFRAMELIAASRIAGARRRAQEAQPYDQALTQAVALLSLHSNIKHPLTRDRSDTKRVAVVAVTSDRGMAGAYSATILRETERLVEKLVEQGREPVLYTAGRRGQGYFKFRGIHVERAWSGDSDAPTQETVDEMARVLVDAFVDPDPTTGVSELYVVFTRFKTMVRQDPEIRRMLPLKVVEREPLEVPLGLEIGSLDQDVTGLPSLYDFEPSADEVLDALLPMYMRSRIRNALLQSAASELASRQSAMHAATDNAEELITNYTRLANTARQAEITQEISEIVSGADALAAG